MKQIIIFMAFNWMFAKTAFAYKLIECPNIGDSLPNPIAKFASSDIIFQVGMPMPSFEGKSADGKKIAFADYKGKILVINFWFVYCTPCLAEMPVLNTVKQRASPDEVAFLSITYDSAALVNNLHKLRPFSFDKIVEAKALVDQFKITGYPRTIVIDKKGIIQYIFRGAVYKAKDLEDVIEKLQKK